MYSCQRTFVPQWHLLMLSQWQCRIPMLAGNLCISQTYFDMRCKRVRSFFFFLVLLFLAGLGIIEYVCVCGCGCSAFGGSCDGKSSGSIGGGGGGWNGVACMLLPLLTMFNVQCSSSPQIHSVYTLPTAAATLNLSQHKYVCYAYTDTDTHAVRRYFIAFLFITL